MFLDESFRGPICTQPIIEIFISVKSKQTPDHISQMRLSSNWQKNNGICLFKMITTNSGRTDLFHFVRPFKLSSVSTNTQIAVPSQVNSPGHFNKRQISILKKCVFDIFERNYCIIWDDVVAIVIYLFSSFFYSAPIRRMDYKDWNHLIYLRRPYKSLCLNWFYFGKFLMNAFWGNGRRQADFRKWLSIQKFQFQHKK